MFCSYPKLLLLAAAALLTGPASAQQGPGRPKAFTVLGRMFYFPGLRSTGPWSNANSQCQALPEARGFTLATFDSQEQEAAVYENLGFCTPFWVSGCFSTSCCCLVSLLGSRPLWLQCTTKTKNLHYCRLPVC